MLLACAIHYLKALTDEILVLNLSRSGFLGISLIFCLFCHNFSTRNAKKRIKPSKDLYCNLVSNKISIKKLALGVGVQGLIILSKYAQTNSHYDVTNNKAII